MNNSMIDPATGEGWDQHVYWDDDHLLDVANVPAVVRKLMGARSRLRRMEDAGAFPHLLAHERWWIHQVLDQVDMWTEWLREEIPGGKFYESTTPREGS